MVRGILVGWRIARSHHERDRIVPRVQHRPVRAGFRQFDHHRAFPVQDSDLL